MNAERAERIRSLAESLSADEMERDRLKPPADENPPRPPPAGREFVRGPQFEGATPGPRVVKGRRAPTVWARCGRRSGDRVHRSIDATSSGS